MTSGKAPHNRGGYDITVCFHESGVYEAVECRMDADFPNCERKLYLRLQRTDSAGRYDGNASESEGAAVRNYHFVIKDGCADGILPDGTHFLIDVDMIPTVEKYGFHLNHKGYPYVPKFVTKTNNIFLHWLVLG